MAVILAILLLILLFVVMVLKFWQHHKVLLKDKHVVITGGSSGIGKAMAILAAKRGAHVTILARNTEKLIQAQKEIQSYAVSEKQEIQYLSVDVSNFKSLENGLGDLDTRNPIFMLVTCAGMAICAEIENYTEQQIKTLVDVNFLGTLYAIKAMTPRFKNRKSGIFVLVGSQASLMGVYGLSVYSACKFALRGLAESLYMEVKAYDISVTLALPPDTDTPGFESENQSKPKETKLISQTAGLMKPELVAETILNDAMSKKFFSYLGFESGILTTLCVGMAPFNSFLEIIIQLIVLGPLRLISSFYIYSFHKIIHTCYLEKKSKQ